MKLKKWGTVNLPSAFCIVRNRSLVFLSARFCQYLLEAFLTRSFYFSRCAQSRTYLKGRRFYSSEQSPSRLHAKVSALVSGETTSFFIIHFGAYSVSFVSRAHHACYNDLSCTI
uniref:Uncharacterized protein n=1 Tax=Hyaloperonospora arabidopsidis (strain Emoy2) TaxID=559515 RepID=M4BFW5_HYAAE